MLCTGSPAILKERLKLIPFTHVNFSPEFNILSEREFGSCKKKFQSLPSLVPKKNKSLPSLVAKKK